MCLNPKWIYKKGNYKEDNYRGNKGDFYELGTYSKCGSCEVCLAEKCNNWVVRNTFESRDTTFNNGRMCFITLTYKENPYIIVKKDFSDFMKRFRTQLDRTTGEKIRFMGCHEYGTHNQRPHHHAIIYGWNDSNADFLTINKKKKLVLQSKLIENCWGLGRTSYQEFNAKEIPYIAIYTTPQEEFKKGYKMTREKLKKLQNLALNPRMNENQRKNLQEELKAINAEFEDEKVKYKLLKESNSWSIGIGWNQFEREYMKSKDYVWEEYIDDSNASFVTPSPWVKKLANMGDIRAMEEMYRREELIKQSATEEEEQMKNIIRVLQNRRKEILEWQDKRQTVEDF
jgi:hypothetical protein